MGGTPPPLYGQNFWQIGGYGFGGYPPHSEPMAQSEPGPGHNLIGVSAVDYVSKIIVLGSIAIKIYFLRKTFDGIL